MLSIYGANKYALTYFSNYFLICISRRLRVFCCGDISDAATAAKDRQGGHALLNPAQDTTIIQEDRDLQFKRVSNSVSALESR